MGILTNPAHEAAIVNRVLTDATRRLQAGCGQDEPPNVAPCRALPVRPAMPLRSLVRRGMRYCAIGFRRCASKKHCWCARRLGARPRAPWCRNWSSRLRGRTTSSCRSMRRSRSGSASRPSSSAGSTASCAASSRRGSTGSIGAAMTTALAATAWLRWGAAALFGWRK